MDIVIYNIKGVSFQRFDKEKYIVNYNNNFVYSILNIKTQKAIFIGNLQITSIKIEEIS